MDSDRLASSTDVESHPKARGKPYACDEIVGAALHHHLTCGASVPQGRGVREARGRSQEKEQEQDEGGA